MAYDTAVPRLGATAEVFITVLRNLVGPIFNPATYEVTIREDIAVNTYIQKLNVSDADGVSRIYLNACFTELFCIKLFEYPVSCK